VNGAQVQANIYKGYARAAAQIGVSHAVFRPSSPRNPLTSANQVATLPASFNLEDGYERPNKYGNGVWRAIVDGTQLRVGDYLVGLQTWFIAGLEALLPIVAIQCNRTLNFVRPAQVSGAGAVGYGGDTQAAEMPLMTGWPASVLDGGKSEANEVRLPGDTHNPSWAILVPAIAGVTLRVADVAIDDQTRRLVLTSAELTEFGWRLSAVQAET
jgi:hypothetical protein